MSVAFRQKNRPVFASDKFNCVNIWGGGADAYCGEVVKGGNSFLRDGEQKLKIFASMQGGLNRFLGRKKIIEVLVDGKIRDDGSDAACRAEMSQIR